MRKIFMIMMACWLLFPFRGLVAQVTNTSMEVMDYREVDGKIVVDGMLNGKPASFALDLSGHNALRAECLEAYGIDRSKAGKFAYDSYVCRDYTPAGSVVAGNVTVGNLASGLEANFFVLENAAYLEKLGVVGTIDGTFFRSACLTIDASRKKLTVTAPYRPTYMKLTNRRVPSWRRGPRYPRWPRSTGRR